MRRCLLCLATLLFLAAEAAPAHAGVLYSQPSSNIGFFYSQNDTSGLSPANPIVTYDNFTLGSTATIASATWVGGFLPSVVNNTITSFTLTFYNDNAGTPGTAITAETIPGNAGQAFLGRDVLQDYVYGYRANLPTPVPAVGGTQYWVSIVANLNTGGTSQWGWENGTGGDGAGFQSFGTAPPGPITSDSAFTLSDSAAVPEPTSLGLLAIGIAGIAGCGWRRRNQRM